MVRENLNPTRQEALAVLDGVAANKFNEMITAFQKNPDLRGGGIPYLLNFVENLLMTR